MRVNEPFYMIMHIVFYFLKYQDELFICNAHEQKCDSL
jgi:hypothetical protein